MPSLISVTRELFFDNHFVEQSANINCSGTNLKFTSLVSMRSLITENSFRSFYYLVCYLRMLRFSLTTFTFDGSIIISPSTSVILNDFGCKMC